MANNDPQRESSRSRPDSAQPEPTNPFAVSVAPDQSRQGLEYFRPGVIREGVIALVICAVLALLTWPYGLVLVVVIPAVVVMLGLRRRLGLTTDPLIDSIGATPLPSGGTPLVHAQITSMAATVGVEVPRVFQIESDSLNVGVLGLGPGTADVVLTSAMTTSLAPIELEAVIGWALMQIHRGDYIAETRAVLAAGPKAWTRGPASDAVLKSVLTEREDHATLEADMAAASVTRFPPGLVEALRRMTDNAELVDLPSALATRWLIDPRPAGSTPRVGPDVALRIALLHEL